MYRTYLWYHIGMNYIIAIELIYKSQEQFKTFSHNRSIFDFECNASETDSVASIPS